MTTTENEVALSGLKLLRNPFSDNQIGKLPKPTRQQTEAVKSDYTKGIRCEVCGGWHHPKVVHLDYVGHAALTDRFLDADEKWDWQPLALDDSGLPRLDKDGLLWIKLTIDGMTRIGVGDAGNKQGGDAMKERIGDALRNAGMRFGAALDLWHKGDLHVDEADNDQTGKATTQQTKDKAIYDKFINCKSMDELSLLWGSLSQADMHLFEQDKDNAKARLSV